MSITFLELQQLLRNRLTLSAMIAFALVMLLSLVSNWQEIKRDEANKSQVAAAERDRWLNQGNKDPHSAAHYSVHVFKPSPPLALIDPGIQPFIGQTVYLEAHIQNDTVYRPMQEAASFQRSGLPSPVLLLAQWAPLLAILFGYALVASDVHGGTLRLAQANAQGPLAYLGGKFLAVSLAVFATFLLPILPFALGMAISADSQLIFRLALWLGLAALYIAIFAMFATTAYLLSRQVRMVFLTLCGLWVLLVIVAPRILSNAVEVAAPLPSFTEVKNQLATEAPSYWSAETGDNQAQLIMQEYGVDSPEDLPIDLRSALLDFNERHAQDVFDRVLGGFYDAVETQDKLYGTASIISPTAALRDLSSTIAGTDFTNHRHFIDSAETYRRDLVNKMNGELVEHTDKATGHYQSDGSLWAQVPDFEFVAQPVGKSFASMVGPLLSLLLWLGLGVALLYTASRRFAR